MGNCGFLFAIIAIIVILFFLWCIWQLDSEPCDLGVVCYDNCGNNVPYNPQIIISEKTDCPKNNLCDKVTKACLDKFAQYEHEIDTLYRSYIIEQLCSCQSACDTYARIEALCDKIGDCLAHCYDRNIGDQYTQLKKACCQQLKNCLSEEVDWSAYERQIANLLSDCNPHCSRSFLENIRREHCDLTQKMLAAYTEKNDFTAMVLYDSIKEKTDVYVENVTASTLRYKGYAA